MDKLQEFEFLKELSEVQGISGHEHDVATVVIKYAKQFASRIEFDKLGSVIAYLDGPKGSPVVMMTGHMDEVGFLVSRIDENGFMFLNPIGGWWGHVLPSMPLTLKNKKGECFYGVIGARPPHGMSLEEKGKVIPMENYFFDMGVTDAKMVEKLGIEVGDTLTPNTPFRVLADNDTLLGKAWDDRLGLAVSLKVLENLKKKGSLKCTYVAVGTVQEEVGCRGAKTAANYIKPDICFATDVSFSADSPASPKIEPRLRSGVSLCVYDAGVIAHPGLLHYMENLADELKIPYTHDFMTGGRTDASTMVLEHSGAIGMTINLPCRYFHSANSMISYSDYENAVNLMTEAVLRMDEELYKSLLESRYN